MLLAALEALLRAMPSCGGPAPFGGLSPTDGHGMGLPPSPAMAPLGAGSSCAAGGGVPAPASVSPASERDLLTRPLTAFISDRRGMTPPLTALPLPALMGCLGKRQDSFDLRCRDGWCPDFSVTD